jgi:pyridoxamine 5'-phosphate oxidase
MADWISELRLIVAAEYHARRVIATLATVDADGNPRARSVIVRRIEPESGALWITSDARSRKIADLKAHPSSELVFWMFNERLQFRLLGNVEIIRTGAVREEIWRELGDASRAMFLWPTPGEPRRAGDVFAQTLGADEPVHESFALLVLRPREVEALELNDTPHLRRRWLKANDWQVERINP